MAIAVSTIGRKVPALSHEVIVMNSCVVFELVAGLSLFYSGITLPPIVRQT
ncbi:hypothetical protein [Sphingomonas yabuuchiae]|uniref:hypothetical protein n=1 Tax=Sphingomonas yabuuchiae TaxID=172044 RepID=UPI0016216218|nr:hypothetical protein [Sphingomonas yabuuchiae]